MATFTTIAAATVAVGAPLLKGSIANSASKTAARMAGRLNLKKEQLEQDSIARLEANYYDAVRANTDMYDKQLQTGNAITGQIIETAAEGDQRGLSATAGKVKQASDATLGVVADKFAAEKTTIDMARAAASEKDASTIAGLFDDRAAAAGVKADALTQQADNLKGQAIGSFIDAGTSALSAGVTAFGGIGGGANGAGNAIKALLKSGAAKTDAEALEMVKGLDGKQLRQISKSGQAFQPPTPAAPALNMPTPTNMGMPGATAAPAAPADPNVVQQVGASINQAGQFIGGQANTFFQKLQAFQNPFGDFSKMFENLGIYKPSVTSTTNNP
jgi:hypothetical protein